MNRIKEAKNAGEFAKVLNDMMTNELTNDFWSITLPANLDSSSARNPELFAFIAAQNRLGSPVLFSHKKVSDLLDPALKTNKKALERHHLFPRKWLEKQGVNDLKLINQMANFALLEWPTNISISDAPPSQYVAKIRESIDANALKHMSEHHALPEGWENMNYDEFLRTRRGLMASVIQKGFDTLK